MRTLANRIRSSAPPLRFRFVRFGCYCVAGSDPLLGMRGQAKSAGLLALKPARICK